MTRSAPDGASITASIAPRGMLGASSLGHQGSAWRSTRPTGRREKSMLPKRRRLPASPGRSTAPAKNAAYPGSSLSSIWTWFSPLLPGRAAKPIATSSSQIASASAPRALATMRAGSTLPSAPRHHWTVQVSSFMPGSIDNAVGQDEDLPRNLQLQELRGAHVRGQLEFRWLLERQVGGLRAENDAMHEVGGPADVVRYVEPVAKKTACFGEFPNVGDGGQAVLQGERSDLSSLLQEERVAQHDQALRASVLYRVKGAFEGRRRAGGGFDETDADALREHAMALHLPAVQSADRIREQAVMR